jgi:ArsR family transcriptional regulator
LRQRRYFGIVGSMNNTNAVAALAALAQDSRLAIFRLLVQNAPAGLTVGVIAEQLELPAPTLSFHLKTLAHAGLVSTLQEGRFVRCRAEMGRIDALIGFLTDNCCDGNPEICKPAATHEGAFSSAG